MEIRVIIVKVVEQQKNIKWRETFFFFFADKYNISPLRINQMQPLKPSVRRKVNATLD